MNAELTEQIEQYAQKLKDVSSVCSYGSSFYFREKYLQRKQFSLLTRIFR